MKDDAPAGAPTVPMSVCTCASAAQAALGTSDGFGTCVHISRSQCYIRHLLSS